MQIRFLIIELMTKKYLDENHSSAGMIKKVHPLDDLLLDSLPPFIAEKIDLDTSTDTIELLNTDIAIVKTRLRLYESCANIILQQVTAGSERKSLLSFLESQILKIRRQLVMLVSQLSRIRTSNMNVIHIQANQAIGIQENV